MRFTIRRATLAGAAIFALALTSCAANGPGTGTETEAAADGKISIVASTNTYSDIAAAIGGERVAATAIIDNTSQDPHSYEGTARDRLALSEADLIIRNGGGFDPFMEQLAAEDSTAPVIDAVETSGLGEAETAAEEEAAEDAHAGETAEEHAAHGAVNEHVWYSLPAISRVAEEITKELSGIDPDNAAEYEANAAAFTEDIDALEERVTQLRGQHEGKAIAATAPLAEHLLTDTGLVDETPKDFLAAIEAGNDAPPAALKEAQDLVTAGKIALLAYNSQVEGPQSQGLKAAADEAGVPVVDFSETLPEGVSYQDWMGSNLDQLETALNR
ncbi:metal ABC transporter solute-binding protein, Zn/Mn family [Arthrobacter crystallopoietes]|uniref:Zinc/manganese transport system substrate-binding protein n=1 Tax=Crystallibacter crystallopoietes TaxID=37928 RepID=A0A1H1CS09_9MICC|nr:zinc ABC transporter substrate-binding protein [Arthrobacter crystallopoietes]AUI50621.1 hypothetical protein AC20117_07070 [Arthrobacter crystallopoietes]SDQ67097.1 zinc/manganese transport system substrate-binding protein [Arthrobacter crystallopoietes]